MNRDSEYVRANQKRVSTVYGDMQKVLKRTKGYWPDPNKCGNHVPQELVDQLLDHKLPIEVILENNENAALLTKISLPSSSWFYNYVRWFVNHPDRAQQVISKRYGKEEWEKNYLVFDSFVYKATLPLQYVFVDHWLLDVFIVDEKTRSEISRLWLTVYIDAKTRAVLGRALLYEYPCIESVQTALLHCIWPKQLETLASNTGSWECYGIPHMIFMDNAWAHHSHSVEQLCRAVGQKGRFTAPVIVFRPPYKGRYGAIIERFFCTAPRKLDTKTVSLRRGQVFECRTCPKAHPLQRA